jgi:hypothetical protein
LNSNYAGDDDETTYTDDERRKLILRNDCIYRHKVIRVNYTTYDMRRKQDSLNPRTHANIMLLSQDQNAAHPYWYARILGVFHAEVTHPLLSSQSTTMDFAWIRWYGEDPSSPKSIWASRRMYRIGFVPQVEPSLQSPQMSPAFGFIDPALIIRGAYVEPAFAHGMDYNSLPPSLAARKPDENDADYNFYYVNQ